jgi:hypothetical protein
VGRCQEKKCGTEGSEALGKRPCHQNREEGSIVISRGLNSVKRQLEIKNETNPT